MKTGNLPFLLVILNFMMIYFIVKCNEVFEHILSSVRHSLHAFFLMQILHLRIGCILFVYYGYNP
jgi:hypothetical protein